MKRAIILGATGVLGLALINELINNNIEVLVLHRDNSKRISKIPTSPLVTKMVCSMEQLHLIQNEESKKYDVFYHFAWSGTTYDQRNDPILQEKNIQYSLDAVSLAKRFGCEIFIGAGSQSEYGIVDGLLRSDTPTNPIDCYGSAKLCAGQLTRIYAHSINMKHVWVRITSAYGPNCDEKIMVMDTINKLKNGELPKFTKAEQKWDFINSKDAATVFRLIAEKRIDNKIYVLGSGEHKTLKEYILEIRDTVSPDTELFFGDIPYVDNKIINLDTDISELRNDLGWEPKISFREGIMELI